MSELEDVKRLLPFSCKIEADQKCLKISTHSYAETGPTAVREATDMWTFAKELLEKEGFKVAPL